MSPVSKRHRSPATQAPAQQARWSGSQAKSCSPRSSLHLLLLPVPLRALKLRGRGPLPLGAPPSAPAPPSTPSPAGGDCGGDGAGERWAAKRCWALGRRGCLTCARRPLRGNWRPAARVGRGGEEQGLFKHVRLKEVGSCGRVCVYLAPKGCGFSRISQLLWGGHCRG